MREDACGLFWDDTPPPREVKAPPPKREPPARTWEEPGYLPYLEEARAFPVRLFTFEELEAARSAGELFVMDSEIYENYYLLAFASVETGKVVYFENIGGIWYNSFGDEFSIAHIISIFDNFITVGFNSNFFDMPIAALALAGLTTAQLKEAANRIIFEELKSWMVLRQYKAKLPKANHIDLIEVAPLQASLKIYGGRLHVPRLQELPFKHSTILNADQLAIVRWYCIGSDLTATAFLFTELAPQLELRAQMSLKYGVDLRSKSDAQIAEAVIVHELTRYNYGTRPTRPEIPPGTSFQYQVPAFISYQTEQLQIVLATVAAANFVIEESGAPKLPEEISNLHIELNGSTYQMGIGGLHSNETKVAHYADENTLLVDRDVTSYYPSIILNLGLYPKHLGQAFLEIYRSLVERRVAAKKAKNKTEADTLKIVVNGSFGKLGSKWSVLYAPDLMIQVTITGQLSLLMLIERLELAGIKVCSANTDGVLVKCDKSMEATLNEVVAGWERDTGFGTEATSYRAIFARDVNNYIAVKEEGKADARFLDEWLGCKVKGAYCERGSAGDSVLSKNPQNLISIDAVLNFLCHGEPVENTVRNCRDIRRFVSVRTVKGGAVKDGEYLGKAIRFYQSNAVGGEIIYAESGNKVPNSENCRPLMDMNAFPDDIDFARYEKEAFEILAEIGYPVPEVAEVVEA